MSDETESTESAETTETTETTQTTSTPTAAEVAAAAAESAAAGIASYTHGSRSVTRLSPGQLLDVADRLAARAHRSRRGPFMVVSQGGGGSLAGGGGGGGTPVAAGVASLNGLTGALSLVAGSNVTVSEVGGAIVIAASGEDLETILSAVQGNDFSSLTLGGETITAWPETDTAAILAAVQGNDFSSLTLGGETITEWPSGGGVTGRVVTESTATMAEGETLIVMDGETAGGNQSLALPDLSADFASLVVRQIGDETHTVITHAGNAVRLEGDGSALAFDWVASRGEWLWREAM